MDIRLPSTSQASISNDSFGNVISTGNSSDELPSKLAKPLHLQQLEEALRLDNLLRQVESTLNDKK